MNPPYAVTSVHIDGTDLTSNEVGLLNQLLRKGGILNMNSQQLAEHFAGTCYIHDLNPLDLFKNVDELISANELCMEERNGYQLQCQELKHENEKLELELLDVKLKVLELMELIRLKAKYEIGRL
jgi:hypothetical protein